MDEPAVTPAPPPARLRSLAQQETDFTSEGSPPPGAARPAASTPEPVVMGNHARGGSAVPISVQDATIRDAAAARRSAAHGKKRHVAVRVRLTTQP